LSETEREVTAEYVPTDAQRALEPSWMWQPLERKEMADSLIPISDEQAKLGQEIVRAGRDVGGWLADILDDLPKELLGLLVGDKVKVKRRENIIKLCEKAKKRLADQGIEEPACANSTRCKRSKRIHPKLTSV
jgi:hypothetical protein